MKSSNGAKRIFVWRDAIWRVVVSTTDPFVSPTTISLQELEGRLWIARLFVGGLYFLAVLLLHTKVESVLLGTATFAYVLGYILLKLSQIRCPWFCGLLFTLDISFITVSAMLTGGSHSILWSLYLFPVAVMSVTRGTRAAFVLGTVVLVLRAIVGNNLSSSARFVPDRALIYGIALIVGAVHGYVTKSQSSLTKAMITLQQGVLGFTSEESITDLLSRSVALGAELTGATYGAVSVWNENNENVYFQTFGLTEAETASLGHAPHASGLLLATAQSKTPIRLLDTGTALGELHLPPGHPQISNFLGVPITSVDSLKGAFYLINKVNSRSFTLEDERLCQMMAGHAASALVIRRLVEDQKEMHDSLLEMLTKINDAREHASTGHSERVRSYARALAKRVGIKGEQLELIAAAGLLHDIGKIGVPESILGKPGPLTDEERSLMMTHSTIGAEIVSQAVSLSGAAPFVRHHHEHWNGRGYPDSLKEDHIPLGARIVAIADALDAITDSRPYRSARSLSAAINEITNCAGSQFDPQLVAYLPDVVTEVLGSFQSQKEMLVHRHEPTLAEQHSAARSAGWRLFTRLAKELDSLLDPNKTADQILKLLCSDLDVSGAAIALLEQSGSALKVIAWEGVPVLVPLGTVLQKGEGLPWFALESGQTQVIVDVVSHPRYGGLQNVETATAAYLTLRASGKTAGVLILYRPLPQSFGEQEIAYLEAVATPVAELLLIAQLHHDVQEASITDSLTNVRNRRYGIERLTQACARQIRSGTTFSLILLDLDGFKAINDKFGHQAGDMILQEAVKLIEQCLRVEDVLARYGGDEFLIITSAGSPQDTLTLTKRLASSTEYQSIHFEGHNIMLPRWSTGIANCPKDGSSANELLHIADKRLYADKRSRTLGTST